MCIFRKVRRRLGSIVIAILVVIAFAPWDDLIGKAESRDYAKLSVASDVASANTTRITTKKEKPTEEEITKEACKEAKKVVAIVDGDKSFVIGVYVRTKDGDTFVVDIPGGYPFERWSVRPNDVNTPELTYKVGCVKEREKAYLASAFTQGVLETASVIAIQNPSIGSFGRMEGDVFVDGKKLSALLVCSGHGKPSVKGKPKYDWCD